MENISTLTNRLRNDLKIQYEILKANFYIKNNEVTDDEDDFDDEYNSDFDDDFDTDNYEVSDEENEDLDNLLIEEQTSFEEKVFLNLVNYIKNNKYKNFFYLIILKDAYEFIKSKLLTNSKILNYESEILEKLELHDIEDLLKKFDESEIFFLDMLTIFFEYDLDYSIIDRHDNREILKLDKNNILPKFKISLLDDIQYEYSKRRF